MSKIIAFLKDVKLELSRVNWPTRQQTVQYSLVVIAVSVVFALYLGGLDALFSLVLNKLLIK